MHRAPQRLALPETIALGAIVLAGTIVRCRYLTSVSPWFDETFCWKVTAFDWSELCGRVARDNHPPLYFILLKAWIAVWGDSLLAMRSLSVALGAISTVGVFLLVRESEGWEANLACRERAAQSGSLAALGLALSPIQIEYSQEIRMYALGGALTIWTSWSLVRALKKEEFRIRDFTAYLPLAVALSYTHYYGLFILLGQFLFTLGTCLGRDDDGRRSRRAVTGAAVFALIGLLWLPWLPNFLAHRVQVEQAFWTKAFDWHDVVYACWAMWTGIWSQHYPPLVQGRTVLFASMAYWLFLLVFGRGGTRWFGLAPLVTFGCAIIASWEGRNIVYARYFVMVQTLVVCGVAVGIQRLPWNLSRAIAAVVWIGTLCGLCRGNDMRRERCAQMPGFPAAIAELEKVRAPGEAVITFQPEVQVDVGFYVPDREIVRLITPERPFDFFHGTAAIRDREYLSLESVSQWPTDRLWVVFRRHLPSGEPPPQLPAPWQKAGEREYLYWYLITYPVVVAEYRRHSP